MTHPTLDNLQDPNIAKALDPEDMLALVKGFPEQIRTAFHLAQGFKNLPAQTRTIRNVVVCGMGGSAISGDLAKALMDEYGTVPLTVVRDYTLPNWVGEETLVVALSYSGNTEETLATYRQAIASKCLVAAVTTGGKLQQFATADNIPLVTIPSGQPPRTATGYLFFPLVQLLTTYRLLSPTALAGYDETVTLLDALYQRYAPNVPTSENLAKQLATALMGKIPIIYGSLGYCGAVGVRWKGQFNENTKIAAFSNVLPEQNHNEALAWVQAHLQAQNWAVLFLRDPKEATDKPRIAKRVELTSKLPKHETPILEVFGEGEALLARIFTLLYMADFVTVYLAFLYGVCPTNMTLLEEFKRELAQMDSPVLL